MKQPIQPEKTPCYCAQLSCLRTGAQHVCQAATEALVNQVLNKVAGVGYCPIQPLPYTGRYTSAAAGAVERPSKGRAGIALLMAAGASALLLLLPRR